MNKYISVAILVAVLACLAFYIQVTGRLASLEKDQANLKSWSVSSTQQTNVNTNNIGVLVQFLNEKVSPLVKR